MSKPIICVYQDCILCGDRGRKTAAQIAEAGIEIRKVSFASPEGRELVYKALFEHGIGKMPFFTDGKKFSMSWKDFIELEVPELKTKRKTRRKKKGVANGNNTKA